MSSVMTAVRTPTTSTSSPVRTDGGRRVSIVEADAGLCADLDERSFGLAQRYAGVVLQTAGPGPWDPSSLHVDAGGEMGVLILEGMVTRQTHFGAGVALEILGPDDLISPGMSGGALGVEEQWTVMTPVTAAVLDPTFAEVAARIPGLTVALLARAHARSERLALHLTIAALPRVEDRLLGLLSLLAERFGRVGVDGIHLALPLTHATLGLLIGARRPTITLAVTALRDRGILLRTEGGGWLLPRSNAPETAETAA